MDRRTFLAGLGIACAAPAMLAALSGCSKSSTSSTAIDGFTIESSTSSSPGGTPHSHSLTIPLADLANPPAAGVSYVSGVADGHTHQVTVSGSDLADIQQGQARTESSTVVSGHQHTFTIRRP
jgi:hypothetical protein